VQDDLAWRRSGRICHGDVLQEPFGLLVVARLDDDRPAA